MDEPIKRRGEYYCSSQCANIAQGIDPDEPLLYDEGEYDEDFLEADEL